MVYTIQLKCWSWYIKIYVQPNDVSWGLTYTYPYPIHKAFSHFSSNKHKIYSLLKFQIEGIHIKLLDLKMFKYVKCFNKFQYLILNSIIQNIQPNQISKDLEMYKYKSIIIWKILI